MRKAILILCLACVSIYAQPTYFGGETAFDLEKFHKRSCELESANSCYLLGSMYKFGSGNIKQNRKVAKKYYKKACDLGEEAGCISYEDM